MDNFNSLLRRSQEEISNLSDEYIVMFGGDEG